jgi:hypothetical protein
MNEQGSSFRILGVTMVVSSLLLAAGIYAGGFFIGNGISNWNSGRRIIAVKGLSEREAPASVAVWTISYNTTGNNLDAINPKLSDSTKAVVAFLKGAGFDDKDMSVQPPALHDASMEPRDKNVPPPPERFRAEQSVLLRTAKVDLIKPALASASTLMVNGVHLSGGCQPNYIYNQLNEIKPAMIQEATGMRASRPSSSPAIRKPVWENCAAHRRVGFRWKTGTPRRRNAKLSAYLSTSITKSTEAHAFS